MEARLALAEFLLASADLQASARQGIDWLATHAGVRQALVAVVDHSSPTLLLVAEHGVSAMAIAEFVVGRERCLASAGRGDARAASRPISRAVRQLRSPFGRTQLPRDAAQR